MLPASAPANQARRQSLRKGVHKTVTLHVRREDAAQPADAVPVTKVRLFRELHTPAQFHPAPDECAPVPGRSS